MKIKVTRKTWFGFNVNTCPSQGERGYYFEKPESPYWVGTWNTAHKKMQEDRFLQSLSNTMYSSSWFVKVGKDWKRVKIETWQLIQEMDCLYTREDWWNKSYQVDSVEIEVED